MKQILIVEDDSFLNKMVAYNLTADGYGVTSALNARTAAEAIRQREFDLVLLDINLPDGDRKSTRLNSSHSSQSRMPSSA